MNSSLHFILMTPPGRPLMSRALCDLSAQRLTGKRFGVTGWRRVNCPDCLAAGQETVDAVLALPDAALVAMGAWVES